MTDCKSARSIASSVAPSVRSPAIFHRSDRLTASLVLIEVGLLLVAERVVSERAPREPRLQRLLRNGVLDVIALAATSLIERPLALRLAEYADRRRWGLLSRLPGPRWLRDVAAIVLLDYGIYLWHMAMHRVPLLWRLHVVHHADRECDVTTALRIHGVDIVLSVAFRVAQVVFLGVTPRAFTLWQRLFGLSVIFHHANIALPARLERILGSLIVTPRVHGIHHRAERAYQHSNWSSGLALWDRLHGTRSEGGLRGEIGLPAYQRASDVTLGNMLALPFGVQRDPWIPR